MPVTEFAVLPFTGRWEHSSYHDFPQPAITAPYQELPNTLHDKFKKSVTAKVGFFRSMSSHASLQALREPPRPCLTIPDNIFVKLRTSHEVLERISGHRFRFFQQIQDPSIIHIVGKWDSTEAHAAFIASPENQRLLELFGDDVRTEGSRPMEMYHLDTDVFDYPDSETPWLLSAPSVCFQRLSSSAGHRAENSEGLRSFVAAMRNARLAVGGWKIEREPEGTDEFVLFYNPLNTPADFDVDDEGQADMVKATLAQVHETERCEMVPIEGL